MSLWSSGAHECKFYWLSELCDQGPVLHVAARKVGVCLYVQVLAREKLETWRRLGEESGEGVLWLSRSLRGLQPSLRCVLN